MRDLVNFWIYDTAIIDINSSSSLQQQTICHHHINDKRYRISTTKSAHADILIPLSVLKGKSCARTIASYLKSKGLSFSDIARVLNRDPRTIWSSLNHKTGANTRPLLHSGIAIPKPLSKSLFDSVSESNAIKDSSDSSENSGKDDEPEKTSLEESTYSDHELMIPASILSYRGFSVLEGIIFYLRSQYLLTYSQMAFLLGKNYQTIRTVYKRALKKIEHEDNYE